ncbi:hypothetical protein HYPSUDRAFT_38216 [Hypholoma sublateritium FD-334 SS-4]|uniref:Peptidase C14 caspase domain-containing protein n=1 Tax=Hypholoma sublateritium (strain FD-334 SS-4) TaxID=945553 RepID=A0A0D2PZV4_HYPSF|nr:hypothetical protein HYPSUDRAFT_38216 [Hypholoma sublateritium FD-334 SS-4]
MNSTTKGPRIFALIIGIDNYKDTKIDRLSGAVADAENMRDFLVDDLRVSKDQRIIELYNEQATKSAMIKALKNLATKEEIGKDDPILIYYAGHGSQFQAPDDWGANLHSKIEMLLPYNFDLKGSESLEEQGLLDQTFSALLSDIALNKSNNVTVILDCCHSGSADRLIDLEAGSREVRIRRIDLPANYNLLKPEHINDNNHKGSARSSQAWHICSDVSHVLLAACERNDPAYETDDGHGVFTTALLKLLRDTSYENFTYRSLIKALPALPRSQKPQCLGLNLDRCLFNSTKIRLYSVTCDPQDPKKFILDAGSAAGITKGAMFSVRLKIFESSHIGFVECTKSNFFTSECFVPAGAASIQLQHPGNAYATQTKAGDGPDICFLIMEPDVREALEEEMKNQRVSDGRRSFRLALSSDDRYELIVHKHDSKLSFKTTDKTCHRFMADSHNDIPIGDPNALFSVLSDAAHFYWNLRHSHHARPYDISGLEQKIDIQCLKLAKSPKASEAFEQSILQPDLSNHDFNVNGIISIDISDDTACYGFKIINRSPTPLYAALFYFDVSDLSIDPFYLLGDARNKNVAPTLPAEGKGFLSIGFGDSGTAPRRFSLKEKQKVDVGFLKLYLSTRYVDFSGVAQKSPFQIDGKPRAQEAVPRETIELWDAIIIPVVLERGDLRAKTAERRQGEGSNIRRGGTQARTTTLQTQDIGHIKTSPAATSTEIFDNMERYILSFKEAREKDLLACDELQENLVRYKASLIADNELKAKGAREEIANAQASLERVQEMLRRVVTDPGTV